MRLQDRSSSPRIVGYVAGVVTGFGRSNNVGYLFGLLAGVCYAAWTIITKSAITSYDIPPLLFAATTFAFGTLMFAPVLVYSAPQAVKSSKQAMAFFALAGVGTAIAVIALSFGLEKGEVTVVAPIISVSPLITLILVRIFLERLEKITPTVVMGALLVVAGTILVVVGDTAF